MDDYPEYRDRMETLEDHLWIIRRLVEKTEREVRHVGIVLGICVVAFVWTLFTK